MFTLLAKITGQEKNTECFFPSLLKCDTTFCCVCEDKLEVRYKLDSSREAEVLRSRVRSLNNGQLHTVTIRRLMDSVSVQVTSSVHVMHIHQTQSSVMLQYSSCCICWSPAAH